MARMDDDVMPEPIARIKRAAVAHARAQKREEVTRAELHEAIAAAFRLGHRPREIEAVSPYDRNHNGRIRDAAGIPATRPATVVSKTRVTD